MDWLGSVTEAVGNGWNAAGESLSTVGDGVKSVIPREVTIGFIKLQVVKDGDDSGGRTAPNRYDSAVTGSAAAAAAGGPRSAAAPIVFARDRDDSARREKPSKPKSARIREVHTQARARAHTHTHTQIDTQANTHANTHAHACFNTTLQTQTKPKRARTPELCSESAKVDHSMPAHLTYLPDTFYPPCL